MASIAPTMLFCERCKRLRNDVATGSLVGPCAAAGIFADGAGAWAKANVVEASRTATARVRFTEFLLGTQGYNGFRNLTKSGSPCAKSEGRRRASRGLGRPRRPRPHGNCRIKH